MDRDRAALRAVAHIIVCKLVEAGTDGDDELTAEVLAQLSGERNGKDAPTTIVESLAVRQAQEYALAFGMALDKLLNPKG